MQTPWVAERDAKEVQFHYNDSSAPFYSFVFLVSSTLLTFTYYLGSPMQYRTKTALEILDIIEFDRDALEEEPVVKIGKRKRSSEASTVPNDVSVYVRSDSEELAASTWSSDPVYDREILARENAELKVRSFNRSPFEFPLTPPATAANRQYAQPGREGNSLGCRRLDC
jgi:hypothetical protein